MTPLTLTLALLAALFVLLVYGLGLSFGWEARREDAPKTSVQVGAALRLIVPPSYTPEEIEAFLEALAVVRDALRAKGSPGVAADDTFDLNTGGQYARD